MKSDVFKKDRKYRELSFWRRLWNNSPFVINLAINLDSISNIYSSGSLLNPRDILKMYKDHKILFFRNERPIVLRKGLFSKIRIIDVDEITETEKEELIELLKEKS